MTAIPAKAVIPANDSFRVVSAVKAGTSDPYIEISFSSPLKEGQNLKGLVELDNVGKYYFSTDHNILKVFYEDLGRDEATLNVYTGVRNADSEKLAEPFTRTIRINGIKPQVKIPMNSLRLENGRLKRVAFIFGEIFFDARERFQNADSLFCDVFCAVDCDVFCDEIFACRL